MGIQIDDMTVAQIKLKKLFREEAALIEGDVEIGILEAAIEADNERGHADLEERKTRRDRVRLHIAEEVSKLTTQVLSLSETVSESPDVGVPIPSGE